MHKDLTGQQETERLSVLHQEVETLESGTMVAIEDLEKRLNDLGISELYGSDAWTSALETVEVYTMEKPPSIRESVRQISVPKEKEL